MMPGGAVVWFLVVYLLFVTCPSTWAGDREIRRPPVIDKPPVPYTLYEHGDPVRLMCRASGHPRPRIMWERFKNDAVEAKSSRPPHHTLFFRVAYRGDSGLYRCRAENKYGITISNWVRLQMAELSQAFPGSIAVDKAVTMHRHVVLTCPSLKSIPPAEFSWMILKRNNMREECAVNKEQAGITVTENGDLYISSVNYGNLAVLQNCTFQCTVKNTFLKDTSKNSVKGHYVMFKLVRGQGKPGERPRLVYATNGTDNGAHVKAMVGENRTLQCVFEASPTPYVSWSKAGGQLPPDRFLTRDQGSTLKVKDIRLEDEGDYECVVQTPDGAYAERHTMHLVTLMKPVFTAQPKSVNVTEGGTAIFECKAEGKPEPSILWMQNGKPIHSANPGHNFSLQGGTRWLSVRDVCRATAGTAEYCVSDMMTVQCRATNNLVNGTIIADAYLNVLHKTRIIAGPTNLEVSKPDISNGLSLPCKTITDGSTAVHVTWLYNGVPVDGTAALKTVEDNGSLTLHLTTSWTHFDEVMESCIVGNYTCVANNTYSTDTKEGLLKYERDLEVRADAIGGDFFGTSRANGSILVLERPKCKCGVEERRDNCKVLDRLSCAWAKTEWIKVDNMSDTCHVQLPVQKSPDASRSMRDGYDASGEFATVHCVPCATASQGKMSQDTKAMSYTLYAAGGLCVLFLLIIVNCAYRSSKKSCGRGMFDSYSESWTRKGGTMNAVMMREHQPIQRLKMPRQTRVSDFMDSTAFCIPEPVYQEICPSTRSSACRPSDGTTRTSGYLKPVAIANASLCGTLEPNIECHKSLKRCVSPSQERRSKRIAQLLQDSTITSEYLTLPKPISLTNQTTGNDLRPWASEGDTLCVPEVASGRSAGNSAAKEEEGQYFYLNGHTNGGFVDLMATASLYGNVESFVVKPFEGSRMTHDEFGDNSFSMSADAYANAGTIKKHNKSSPKLAAKSSERDDEKYLVQEQSFLGEVSSPGGGTRQKATGIFKIRSPKRRSRKTTSWTHNPRYGRTGSHISVSIRDLTKANTLDSPIGDKRHAKTGEQFSFIQ